MQREHLRPSAGPAATSTLAGCSAGALLCLAVWPWADARILETAQAWQPVATLLAYLVGAAIIQWTGVAAFQVRYGPLSGVNHGAQRVRLGLVCGGTVALSLAMSIAAASGFSTAPSAVALEVVAVLGCCWLGAYAGASWWASASWEK